MIHEPLLRNQSYFLRSWGYMIVHNPITAKRLLHHSAPHYRTDGDVCAQAAYVFEHTKSRSLIIAGAPRDAVIG